MFQLPLDVDLYINGKVRRERLVLKKDNDVFTFPVDAEPSLVIVDAENMLTGNFNMPISVEQAQFQYLNAPLYTHRLKALDLIEEEEEA